MENQLVLQFTSISLHLLLDLNYSYAPNYYRLLHIDQAQRQYRLIYTEVINPILLLKYLNCERMRSFCEWLCPKRKKQEGPYDVQEQTFEMDEHFGEIQFSGKHDTGPTQALPQQSAKCKQESSQAFNTQQLQPEQKQESRQEDEKKFIESKNKIQQQSPEPKMQPEVQPPVQEPPKPKYNILPSKAKKKAFNPQDYFFKQQQNQFKVKPIDSIKGQQFNIDGCKNGTYFIFDVTANIYIDDCENCFVFAAPCESSIFARSCRNLVIVGIVGQFRTYNCHNCHFSIYCKSQPVIQSSSDIHFSSLTCPEYPQLRGQFEKTKLYPWNNNWSQIHNFTKKQGQTHHYLDKSPQFKQQGWQRAFSEAKIQQTSANQQIVPFIQGILPIQSDIQPTRTLVIFNKEISQNDIKITQWINKYNLHLLRASKSKISNQDYLTVALLIGNYSQQVNTEEVENPVVITDSSQVRQQQSKYFVTFKDER